MHIIVVLLCLLSFAACTSQDSAKTGTQGLPGSSASGSAITTGSSPYSVLIAPEGAVRGTTFYATLKNISPSDAHINWTVNGSSVSGVVGAQFKASDVKRGDIVQASVVVAGSRMESNSIEIKNSPPEFTSFNVVFEAKSDSAAYADVSVLDPDGDPVTIFYEWTKNGEPVGKAARLTVPLKRGDKVFFSATPFDEIDYGKTAFAEKEIQNMPPVIEPHQAFTFDGTTYTYQVKASDPDGDQLSYSLEGAPTGMEINPSTGLVKWIVPPDFKGTAAMTIVVHDGNNGTAQYNLKFTLK